MVYIGLQIKQEAITKKYNGVKFKKCILTSETAQQSETAQM